jgi:hypothetical protein
VVQIPVPGRDAPLSTFLIGALIANATASSSRSTIQPLLILASRISSPLTRLARLTPLSAFLPALADVLLPW